jgi:hypothetical protein
MKYGHFFLFSLVCLLAVSACVTAYSSYTTQSTPAPKHALLSWEQQDRDVDWKEEGISQVMVEFIDPYLKEYRYYSLGNTVMTKGNSSLSNRITIEVYDEYVWVSEIHNYFAINYYFSDDKLEDMQMSPFYGEGSMDQYVDAINANLAVIRSSLQNPHVVYDAEKKNRDLQYLRNAEQQVVTE